MTKKVPAGFEPLFRTSPHLDNLGDFYSKGMGENLVIGVFVLAKNANSRGSAHGGFLASIADVALGYATASSTSPPQNLVTSSMVIDYAGSAKEGDWVESRVEIQKVGKNAAFANCYLLVEGKKIVRASAVFQNFGDISSR